MVNLLQQAETDLGAILGDGPGGDGLPITIIDPDGNTDVFNGLCTDISQIIDPDTGIAISGRSATISIRISLLIAAGFDIPVGIADAKGKPWVVEFENVNGVVYKFKVSQSNPDRTIGLVTCLLEAYK